MASYSFLTYGKPQTKLISEKELSTLPKSTCALWGKLPSLMLTTARHGLATLEASIDEFRPDTNNHVQDLIDPALYLPEDELTGKARLSWIPTKITVKPDIKFNAPIMNVDDAKFPVLRMTIEKVFKSMYPYLQFLFRDQKNLNSLQVIVKAQKYVFRNEKEIDKKAEKDEKKSGFPINDVRDSYEGRLHQEGLAGENIIGVGIYYYQIADELEGGHLEVEIPVEDPIEWQNRYRKQKEEEEKRKEEEAQRKAKRNENRDDASGGGIFGGFDSEEEEHDCGSERTQPDHNGTIIPVQEGNFIIFRNDTIYHRMGKVELKKKITSSSSTSTSKPQQQEPQSSSAPRSSKSGRRSQQKKYPQHNANKVKGSGKPKPKKPQPPPTNETGTTTPIEKKPETYERKILAFFIIDPSSPVQDSTQIGINHRIVIRDLLMDESFLAIPPLVGYILEYLFSEEQAKENRAQFRQRGGGRIYYPYEAYED